ncbi:MAG: DUF2207 domain-containing protein [Pseudoscardovia radai]|nr:DUF2207 domain-containing protein [Pseudoscardovia radai]
MTNDSRDTQNTGNTIPAPATDDAGRSTAQAPSGADDAPAPVVPGTPGSRVSSFSAKRLREGLIGALVACLVIAFAFVIVNLADTGDSSAMQYTNLAYDVQTQPDGSLSIVEDVTVQLKSRDDDTPWHQIYQTYTLDSRQLSSITDVSVTQILDDRMSTTYTKQGFQDPSSVSSGTWDSRYAGHWYLYDTTDAKDFDPATDAVTPDAGGSTKKTLELGWNIAEASSGTYTFRITMTFDDVATQYSDISYFQWEPISAQNTVPIIKCTGTIRMPHGADGSDVAAWLHSDANSTYSVADDGTMTFTATHIQPGQYLDPVFIVDNGAMGDVQRTAPDTAASTTGMRQTIIDQENQKRSDYLAAQQHEARLSIMLVIAMIVLGVLLIIWAMVGAFVSYRNSQYRGGMQYWREPPSLSPAAAARMNSVIEQTGASEVNARSLSSTLLSLASKHCIMLAPGPQDWYTDIDVMHADQSTVRPFIAQIASSHSRHSTRLTTTIALTVPRNAPLNAYNLSASERRLFELLEDAAEELGKRQFDLKEMTGCMEESTKMQQAYRSFETACDCEFAALSATRSQPMLCGAPAIVGFLYLLGLFAIVVSTTLPMVRYLAMGAGTVVSAFVVFATIYGSSTAFTEDGQKWAQQVQCFKNYLLDYSHFNDRDVRDLVLWDRYLVYAAAFGISKKVVKELYLAAPQMRDIDWVDSTIDNSLLYLYISPRANLYSGGVDQTYGGGLPGDAFGGFGDFGANLEASFHDVASVFETATSGTGSDYGGGSFSGGGFSGGGGGAGGGSFGGR